MFLVNKRSEFDISDINNIDTSREDSHRVGVA